MYATNYLEAAALNIMRGAAFTAPSTVYVGLYINNPGETGKEGVELSYTGYERMPITYTEPAEESGGIGVKNDSQITFATSEVDAGMASYIGISDSKVGGNMLIYGKLTDDLEIRAGEAPVLLQGEIVHYLTGNLSRAYKVKLLNILRKQNITGFTPYLALFNGDPESGGAELSGDNYARVALAFTAPAESAGGQMTVSNSTAATFNRPTSAWGNWTFSAIYDAAANGLPVWTIAKDPAKEIKKGYMPTIAEGDIKVGIN